MARTIVALDLGRADVSSAARYTQDKTRESNNEKNLKETKRISKGSLLEEKALSFFLSTFLFFSSTLLFYTHYFWCDAHLTSVGE